jgi:hypothetical protein
MSTDGALARIKHAARFGRVIAGTHARGRMAERGAQARDVMSAIRTATAAVHEEGTKYRLEGGVDTDGDALGVVVAEVQPGLFVVTLF